jgi:sec-independent protein translocase protein TatA
MLTGILEPTHLIVILVVALLFLGPKRLPTAGRAIGQGLREFKDSISTDHTLNSEPHHGEAPRAGVTPVSERANTATTPPSRRGLPPTPAP